MLRVYYVYILLQVNHLRAQGKLAFRGRGGRIVSDTYGCGDVHYD